MVMKTVLFVVVGCFLIVAATEIYTGMRFAIQWMGINMSPIVSSLVAGLVSLLFSTGTLLAFTLIKRLFRYELMVFEDRGPKFIFTSLVLFSLLVMPGYFISQYNLELFIKIIDKKNISSFDVRVLTLVILYAIYMTFMIFVKIRKPAVSSGNSRDTAPN